MTFEEMKNLSQEEQKKLFNLISEKRSLGKTINFAGIYGAGIPKLVKTTGKSVEEISKLYKIYWERNKSVKQVSESLEIKTINNQMWLKNPISNFWYSLRYEKDKFSTCNQGSGVYCFDLYIRELRKRDIKIFLQYHDEKASICLNNNESIEEYKKKHYEAIEEVNKLVKLNVPLNISIDFGDRYSDIH